MVTLTTTIDVEGMSGADVYDFLANPDDQSYREWWPGTHLAFHVRKHGREHVGDVVYMDEYVGTRRLRMTGVVTDAIPGRRLVWQLVRGVELPAHLDLRLDDHDGGVRITHTTRAGFRGAGRLLDPVFRLYFTKRLIAALDDHVRTEFPRLRHLLHERREAAGARAADLREIRTR